MCMLSIEIGGCVIYRNLITHNPLEQPITEHGPFMGIRYIYRIGYGGYYTLPLHGSSFLNVNHVGTPPMVCFCHFSHDCDLSSFREALSGSCGNLPKQ